MWRRAVSSSSLSAISEFKSLTTFPRSSTSIFTNRFFSTSSTSASSSSPPFQKPSPLFSSDNNLKKKLEDVMPIATGHEREELEAELQGRNILEMNFPVGPFGTKEVPAIVKSVYDKRIVGCPGVEGEDEHDVVWFWLEKDKPHECPVCSQHFMLEVVGPGGSPDGH